MHIEIESRDQTTRLKPRLPVYYVHLRQLHELPVLPIVLYLKVGLDGIGIDAYEEVVGELSVLRFQYLYVGLPGLSAVEYVEGSNWLGVALSALMRISREQVVWLGAEALRRLAIAPINEQQRFLLGDCVQAYLALDAEQTQQFDQLIANSSDGWVQAMNKTTYDRGLELGREQGLEEGEVQGIRRSLLRVGRRKLLEPSPAIVARIGEIEEAERLASLIDRVFDVRSWEELLHEE